MGWCVDQTEQLILFVLIERLKAKSYRLFVLDLGPFRGNVTQVPRNTQKAGSPLAKDMKSVPKIGCEPFKNDYYPKIFDLISKCASQSISLKARRLENDLLSINSIHCDLFDQLPSNWMKATTGAWRGSLGWSFSMETIRIRISGSVEVQCIFYWKDTTSDKLVVLSVKLKTP